jgi:hypothetical protein
VVQGFAAEGFHLGAGGFGLQQRMVDERRQVPGAVGQVDELEDAVVETGAVPEQAVPFGAAQQLGPSRFRRQGAAGADFGGEVEEGIEHGSIMAAPAIAGKMDMKKRAEARFSWNQ